MKIVFSIFFHEIKEEKNIKMCISFHFIVFFKHDPRYSICSHVLPFDATVFIFYIGALQISAGPKMLKKLTLVR
jgi:hypothetical protein